MRFMRVPAAVLLAMSLSACIALPISHDVPLSPSISGVVRETATGVPVSGATVRIYGRMPGRARSLTVATDNDGKYAMKVSAHARWWVLVFVPYDTFCEATITIGHPAYVTQTRVVGRGGSASASGPCAGWAEQWNVLLDRAGG